MTLPIIGLTTEVVDGDHHLELRSTFIYSISRLGGIPLLLPKVENDDVIKGQLEHIDALFLTGGSDIDPSTYGENPHPKLEKVEAGRDKYELELIRLALEKDIPILGICRGSQLLNSVAGGTMYQDLDSEYGENLIQHRQTSNRDFLNHKIEVMEGTKLHEIVGTTEMSVNSFHHQANHDIGASFEVAAVAPDGVIEAIESKEHDFVMGLQFHPEDAFEFDDSSRKIMEAFINAAKKGKAE